MNKDTNYIECDGMRFRIANTGYYLHDKWDNYKRTKILLHRYIWEKNNGNIPEGYVVHHIDENKLNNDISNLKLMTISEHHSYHTKGKSYKGYRFTEEQRLNSSKCKMKKILQFDKNNNLIREWNSSKEASEILKIADSSIASCITGRLKYAGGFIFKKQKGE